MWKKIDENFESVLMVALFVVMSVICVLQVIMRYVFSSSLSWSEELMRYLFIWMVYISISYGMKMRKHVKLDVLLQLFPQQVRPIIQIIGEAIVFVFAIAIIFSSYEVMLKIRGLGQMSVALRIPMFYVYLAPFVGFILVTWRTVQNLYLRITNLKKGVEMND